METSTQTKNLITVSGELIVNREVEKVFDFYSNPSNDSLWRTEINKSTLNGPLQTGVIVFEYSHLSKKVPNNLLELKCLEYNTNRSVIFETQMESSFYLKSQRTVTAVSDTSTKVIYKLDFDKSIVKFAVGFALPAFIISWKANSDMKKYLQQLKEQIEKL